MVGFGIFFAAYDSITRASLLRIRSQEWSTPGKQRFAEVMSVAAAGGVSGVAYQAFSYPVHRLKYIMYHSEVCGRAAVCFACVLHCWCTSQGESMRPAVRSAGRRALLRCAHTPLASFVQCREPRTHMRWPAFVRSIARAPSLCSSKVWVSAS